MAEPVILQAERAECALAALAMVLQHHGRPSQLAVLRTRFGESARGISLKVLIRLSQQVGLQARPLRLELVDLGKLEFSLHPALELQPLRGAGACPRSACHHDCRSGGWSTSDDDG